MIAQERIGGVWTPTGEVVCWNCHGPHWHGGGAVEDYQERLESRQPTEFEAVGQCDTCGVELWIDDSIGAERKIVEACRNLGLEADMWQTGGMCSAAGILFPGGYIMVTTIDEPLEVGFYRGGPDEDCPELVQHGLSHDQAMAWIAQLIREHTTDEAHSIVLDEAAELEASGEALREHLEDTLPDLLMEARIGLTSRGIDATKNMVQLESGIQAMIRRMDGNGGQS